MKIKKLTYMPYGQCYVVSDDNTITLISYKTPVLEIKDGWLEVFGLYSMTTRKHIGAFMREYVKYPNSNYGTFQDAKKCYINSYRFNIETGEIEDLA